MRPPVSCVWRASVIAGLIVLIAAPAIATTISQINVNWRDSVEASVRERLESTIQSTRGGALSETGLNRLFASMLSQLGDQGYHLATIRPRDFNAVNDSLTYVLDVEPGPRTRIVKWELLGLVRTDSAWLAQAIPLPTGVVATSSAIREGASRLVSIPNIQLAGAPGIVASGSDSCVVVHLYLRETAPTRFEGAVATGSSEGDGQGLLGRFSLGLNGLFRRGHALDIRYEHPQPEEQLLRLNYSESRALWRGLSSRAQFEDWRRDDHRQRIRADFAISPRTRPSLSILFGMNWQKVAPLGSISDAARLYESSAGLAWRRGNASQLSLTTTYSLHRRWLRQSGDEKSDSRVRIDGEGRGNLVLSAMSSLRISFGARLWGQEEDLRIGDEWFLGGAVLGGYSDRSIAASEGVWSRIELSRSTAYGFGASLFGDLAWLSMFDQSYMRPASLGFALVLGSPARSGRLEVAWKDRATLSDGILRLSVIQGW